MPGCQAVVRVLALEGTVHYLLGQGRPAKTTKNPRVEFPRVDTEGVELLWCSRLDGKSRRSGLEVSKLAFTQLVGGDALTLVGRVRELAHDEGGVILSVTDGGVRGLYVVGVVGAPNQFSRIDV